MAALWIIESQKLASMLPKLLKHAVAEPQPCKKTGKKQNRRESRDGKSREIEETKFINVIQ